MKTLYEVPRTRDGTPRVPPGSSTFSRRFRSHRAVRHQGIGANDGTDDSPHGVVIGDGSETDGHGDSWSIVGRFVNGNEVKPRYRSRGASARGSPTRWTTFIARGPRAEAARLRWSCWLHDRCHPALGTAAGRGAEVVAARWTAAGSGPACPATHGSPDGVWRHRADHNERPKREIQLVDFEERPAAGVVSPADAKPTPLPLGKRSKPTPLGEVRVLIRVVGDEAGWLRRTEGETSGNAGR